MSALNNQTNRNQNRYFFATSENGEQTLGLQYGTTGGTPNISTMAVTISGSGGNGVIVNQAPAFGATEYVFGEEAVFAGSASSYFTPSTLTTTVAGINLTTDRSAGSGIACIESYGTNGHTGGFEFLSRGVDAALLSTPMDTFISSIGRPGATAVLGASGTFVANTLTFQSQTIPINDPSNPGAQVPVFPASKTNQEFGAEGKTEILAGATSNAALYGSPWAPLFSTPIAGLNPNTQTFVSINWVDGLSSGSNHVNYKVGFSTATAYTNTLVTTYVPGSGGTWTPSDIPGPTSPLGGTLVTACLDPDGIAADGSAMLYVQGQFSDPGAPADQIFIAKGLVTEATRNALVWRPI